MLCELFDITTAASDTVAEVVAVRVKCGFVGTHAVPESLVAVRVAQKVNTGVERGRQVALTWAPAFHGALPDSAPHAVPRTHALVRGLMTCATH